MFCEANMGGCMNSPKPHHGANTPSRSNFPKIISKPKIHLADSSLLTSLVQQLQKS